MKKAAVFLGLIVFLFSLSPLGREVGAAVTFSATELLGRPTDTSITVNVVPSSGGQIYFQYGTTTGAYTGQTPTAVLTSGTPTQVVMQGLAPNTRYYYRMVSSGDGVNWTNGTEHSFQTQRAPGSTFKFTITSDSHVDIQLGSATTWRQTMTNIANDHPDFSLDLGDTFAMDGVTTVAGAENAYLFQRQFFDLVGNSAPIFLAIGNHEQEEAWHLTDTPSPANSPPVLGANARKKFYLNPVPDAFYSGNTDPYPYLDGDNLREDYYAWTWGDALFVVIDPFWYTTTKPYIGNIGGGETSQVGSGDRWDWTLGLQQFTWLKQTIENSQAKYKFIFAHHMTGGASDYGGRGGAVPATLVEWGGYDVDGITWGWDTRRPVSQWGSKPVHQIMVDNHVSAFFHGHDHEYAYEKRDGIVYQCLPAAGFAGYGFNSYSVGTYTLKVLPSPGHLRVTVTPAQATVDYVATSGAKVNYSYAIAANSGSNPPGAANDTYTTNENTPLTVVAPGVLGNDTDSQGKSLTAQLATGPSHGTLTLNADGSFTYTPNTYFAGTDSFTYMANDGIATSNTATVTISVTSASCTITASAGTGGTINPTGAVPVILGSSQTFQITANGGYTISNVLVDGASVGPLSSYTFSTVTSNHTITASFAATTNQILTSISVAPASASVPVNGTKQFTATAKDQSGNVMVTQPSFNWSVSGGGTITSSGLFTAGSTAGGPYAVTAASGGVSGTSSVTVTAASSITIGETQVLGGWDNGNGNLLVAQQASLGQTATIVSMSFYVTTAGGSLRMGIYDATGPNGGPGQLKAQTASFTPKSGWNTANVTSSVLLPAGTYWLAYLPSSNSLGFVNTLTGSASYYSYTYGALPSVFSTSPNSLAVHWSFYATLQTAN